MGPRLREFVGQVETEVVSNSRNKSHKTWGPLFYPPVQTNIVVFFSEILLKALSRFGEYWVRYLPFRDSLDKFLPRRRGWAWPWCRLSVDANCEDWVLDAGNGGRFILFLAQTVATATIISRLRWQGWQVFFCKRRGRGLSATARVATVLALVPFVISSKICKIFLVLRFLSVLNNPKFCYVTGRYHCSILWYLPILGCRRLQKVSYKQKES